MGALYVICGDDDFARKERARRCVEALLDGEIEGNPALETVQGDTDASRDAAAGEFLAVLRTPPFLEPHRVVWLRHYDELDRFGDGKPGSVFAEVAGLLLAPERPDDTDIVIDGRSLDLRKGFAKKLKAAGATIESFNSGRPGDRNQAASRRQTIEEFFGAAHKRIAPDGCQYLIDTIGGDSGNLRMELEKLLAYAGDVTTITLDDCRAVTSRTPEALGWEFTSAISEGKLAQSLELLGQLLDSGVAEFQIIGMIASDHQKMVQTRLAMSELGLKRVGPRTFDMLSEETKAKSPGNPLLKMHPYRAFKVCEGASRMSEAELARKLRRIRDAWRELVSGGDRLLVLEKLVRQLMPEGSFR